MLTSKQDWHFLTPAAEGPRRNLCRISAYARRYKASDTPRIDQILTLTITHRRSIGPLIVNEEDEILRMICGQLVKVLLTCDIEIDELWPDDAAEKDYKDFPVTSQSQEGWKAEFQTWVDDAWPQSQQ